MPNPHDDLTDPTDPGEPSHDVPGLHRRVRMSDVDRTLARADLLPLPRLAPPGSHGLKLGQMKDAVLVHCGAGSEADTVALRDRARRALRDGGYIVKDSPQTAALFYVVGTL